MWCRKKKKIYFSPGNLVERKGKVAENRNTQAWVPQTVLKNSTYKCTFVFCKPRTPLFPALPDCHFVLLAARLCSSLSARLTHSHQLNWDLTAGQVGASCASGSTAAAAALKRSKHFSGPHEELIQLSLLFCQARPSLVTVLSQSFK